MLRKKLRYRAKTLQQRSEQAGSGGLVTSPLGVRSKPKYAEPSLVPAAGALPHFLPKVDQATLLLMVQAQQQQQQQQQQQAQQQQQ